jgi:hypothetical protein
VQNQHHQACAVARLGPLEHLLITGRIAECGIKPFADKQVHPDRLAKVVVDEKYFRFAHQNPVCHLDIRT